ALAAGCTFVMKPASDSPITAVKLMELCEEAGFPKGVINLVTGSSSAFGKAIMANEKVRKITFTGSTAVGKQLIKQSADQVKRLSLELGGHAPTIVLDDADVDVAVKASWHQNSVMLVKLVFVLTGSMSRKVSMMPLWKNLQLKFKSLKSEMEQMNQLKLD